MGARLLNWSVGVGGFSYLSEGRKDQVDVRPTASLADRDNDI